MFTLMNLGQIIEKPDFRAHPGDQIDKLLALMETEEHQTIPLIDDGVLMGVITADQLLDVDQTDQKLAQASIPYRQAYLHEEQHILDALSFFGAHEIDIIPVVAAKHIYRGMVTPLGLIAALNTIMGSHQPGGILVLEAGSRDNALSHIAHIVESTNTQILNSHVRAIPDSSKIEVTLKVNTINLSAVTAALLRYDYIIKTTYSGDVDRDDINDRFDHLMNYINM